MINDSFYDRGFTELELLHHIHSVDFGLEKTVTLDGAHRGRKRVKVFVPLHTSEFSCDMDTFVARYNQDSQSLRNTFGT